MSNIKPEKLERKIKYESIIRGKDVKSTRHNLRSVKRPIINGQNAESDADSDAEFEIRKLQIDDSDSDSDSDSDTELGFSTGRQSYKSIKMSFNS